MAQRISYTASVTLHATAPDTHPANPTGGSPPPRAPIPLHQWVLALGMLAAAAVIVGTAWSTLTMRHDELGHAESHMHDVNVLLAEQTSRAVSEIDRILQQAQAESAGRLDGSQNDHGAGLNIRLAQLVDGAPHVRALLLIDAQGKLLAHSMTQLTPDVRYDDRDWLQAHRTNMNVGLFVGIPAKGRVHGEATISFSRGIRTGTEALRGVIVASVRPDYFQNLYRALDLGRDGGVRLLRRDGVLLAVNKPEIGTVGTEYGQATVFRRALDAPHGIVVRHAEGPGGVPRVTALRAVADFPLVIGNSVTTAHALRDWHKHLWFAWPAAGVTALLFLALAQVLARTLRTDARLRSELGASEERWRYALESAEHGVWDWEIATDFVHRSRRYLEIFGLPLGYPDSRHAWRDTVHPDDLPAAREAMFAVARAERNDISTEIRVRDGAGGWKKVLVRGTPVARDEHGKPTRITGTVTDVSALHFAEQRLREQEARVGAIIESAMDAIITIDESQRVLLFNAAAEQVFGVPAEQAKQGTIDRFLPEHLRIAHREHIAHFAATGVTTRRMGAKLRLVGLRSSGEEFPIDASISQVVIDGHKFFTVILRDITQRVAAEREIERSHNELRALSKSANDALESERRRVARELHDELGQQLTAMKLDLSEIEKFARHDGTEPDDALRAACDRMRGLIDQTVASTRRISTDLRPLVLDDLGLGAALDWLTKDFTRRTGVSVSLQVDDTMTEIGEPHASTIFRIVQECLTNISRHAQAQHASVTVESRDGHAHVLVRDDGKGLPPRNAIRSGAFGLIGMRERARLLGGEAAAENHPAGGAVVNARLPLSSAPSDEVFG